MSDSLVLEPSRVINKEQAKSARATGFGGWFKAALESLAPVQPRPYASQDASVYRFPPL